LPFDHGWATIQSITSRRSAISAADHSIGRLPNEAPLAAIYPIVYLDAIHLKLRREGKVVNTAVYVVLGVDLEGQRDVLGHWVGDGAEGANFWLSVVTDLQTRGVEDIFLACIDGLTGFKDAIQAVFPHTHIQRCVIHQVRHRLTYIAWKDRKAFVADLKAIYQASTREAAETKLCSWASAGARGMRWRCARGKATGGSWRRCSTIRPIFGA
jgi:transposase-like protein